MTTDYETLQSCRLVSKQFSRIVTPHAFYLSKITVSSANELEAFQSHAIFAANHPSFAKYVKYLIIAGDGLEDELEKKFEEHACVSWKQIWGIIRYLHNLHGLTLKRLQFKNEDLSVYGVSLKEHITEVLPQTLPRLVRLQLEELSFALNPSGVRSAAAVINPLPLFSSPTLTQLHLHNVNFFTKGQGICVCPYQFSNVCIRSPNFHSLRVVRLIKGIRCLKLWDGDNGEVPKYLNRMVINNKATLETLVLGIDMRDAGMSNFNLFAQFANL